MADFTHGCTEKWFNSSIHLSFSHRGPFDHKQWDHSWSHCSHSVHCLPPRSLRSSVEVHGVTSSTKAQEGEGSRTEEYCVKTGCQVWNILHLFMVLTKFKSRLYSWSESGDSLLLEKIVPWIQRSNHKRTELNGHVTLFSSLLLAAAYSNKP